MATYSIIFSPTGGVRKIGELLLQDSRELVEIDLTREVGPTMIKQEDIAYLLLPSYGGRCPSLALERLKNIKADNTRAILVVVYGNRAYEDTLVELEDAAVRQGFLPIAGVAAIAQHSILHKYASGRPDAEDEAFIRQAVKKIKEKLSTNSTTPPLLPGNRPYKPLGGHMTPHATEECTSCKACAFSCPSGAIDFIYPDKVNPEACIGCMRCIKICPNKARIIDKEVLDRLDSRIGHLLEGRKDNEIFL